METSESNLLQTKGTELAQKIAWKKSTSCSFVLPKHHISDFAISFHGFVSGAVNLKLTKSPTLKIN